MKISLLKRKSETAAALRTRQERGSAVFPPITETKLAQEHRLSISLPRLGEMTPRFVVSSQAKIFPSKFLVEDMLPNPIVDLGIAIANVFQFRHAKLIMGIHSGII